MFGIVIDKETKSVIDECVIISEYELKENEDIISYVYELGNPICNMNKPQWNGIEWIDTEPLPQIEPQPQEPTLEEKVNTLEEDLLKAEQAMMDMEIELLLLK